jgi:hypothetical protein
MPHIERASKGANRANVCSTACRPNVNKDTGPLLQG